MPEAFANFHHDLTMVVDLLEGRNGIVGHIDAIVNNDDEYRRVGYLFFDEEFTYLAEALESRLDTLCLRGLENKKTAYEIND